jgi:nitrogen fixation protein NifU and related proteins
MLSDNERSMLLEQLARTPHALAETYTHEGHARTPSCGDEVTVRATVVGPYLQHLSWEGHGCTVSMAAAEALAGLAPIDLVSYRELADRYAASLKADAAPVDYADLELFAGIGRFPLRGQCATLAWRALAEALAPDPV